MGWLSETWTLETRSEGARRRRRRPRLAAALSALAVIAALVGAAAPAPAGAAVEATGPFTVDVGDREAVRRFYQSVYREANGVAPGWT
ncbi:MAG: hypothetical protein OEY23_24155, partial [Acidimicrobiia bacterium]|nr:hypothetical protein [Acidimicrobiia bacterium]